MLAQLMALHSAIELENQLVYASLGLWLMALRLAIELGCQLVYALSGF